MMVDAPTPYACVSYHLGDWAHATIFLEMPLLRIVFTRAVVVFALDCLNCFICSAAAEKSHGFRIFFAVKSENPLTF